MTACSPDWAPVEVTQAALDEAWDRGVGDATSTTFDDAPAECDREGDLRWHCIAEAGGQRYSMKIMERPSSDDVVIYDVHELGPVAD